MSNAAAEAIHAIGQDLYEEMRHWRRHLHAHPELGFAEYETAAFIRGLLTEWDVPFKAVTETGTVATLGASTTGPVLVVRADIDALPIQEEGDQEYRSRTDGRMHACGHDGHTAIVLGLVKLLKSNPSYLTGEIRFIFQPAEETSEGGAPEIIASGVLDGASAIVGLHLDTNLPTGQMAVSSGAILASDDRFDITITGRGGHSSRPHETVDALVIAAALVGELQTLVSRRVDPLVPAAVSFGLLRAGDVYNVIPGSATLSGTVRTLSPDARATIADALISVTNGFAQAHGATADVTYRRGSPPLINDRRAAAFAEQAAYATVGREGVVEVPAMLGAEDFSYYGEIAPITFAWLGAGESGSASLHHPRFDFDEAALAVGLRYFLDMVTRWKQWEASAPES